MHISNLTLEGSITAEYGTEDPGSGRGEGFTSREWTPSPQWGALRGALTADAALPTVNRVKLQSRLAYTGGVCGTMEDYAVLSL